MVHGSADETAIANETEDGRTRHRRPPERKMAGIADTAATPRQKVPESTTAPHSVGSGRTMNVIATRVLARAGRIRAATPLGPETRVPQQQGLCGYMGRIPAQAMDKEEGP